MKKITILITDDHKLLRETWTMILNGDLRFSVVGGCGSGEEAVELAQKLRPDVVLMDIHLPGISGLEATCLIHKHVPDCRIMGVSFHAQPSYAQRMMQSGAMGYLTKNAPLQELFHAISEVAGGRKYISEEVKDTFAGQMFSGEGTEAGITALSRRELEVISYLRKGYTSLDIADRLMLSIKTVEVHRHNILKKLNLKNTASLMDYVNRHLLPET